MIESGVPDYVVLTYIGVVAPAATPPAIVGKLNAAHQRKPADAGGQRPPLRRLSADVPAGLAAGVRRVPRRASATKWSEVVRLSGIKME